jgi:alpha/beta hydrolase family protein
VFYQIPVNPRELPLVMWHGGGQFGKTWESTPDGRQGFQTMFLRRGWGVYVLDQPRRGRAGRSTDSITITPVASEQDLFNVFRLGIWPDFFPGVQFPRDSNSLAQYFRQQTPNTGPSGEEERDLITDAVSALFDRTGPAVLITHSASGILGWLTAIKNDNVRAIVTYEPTAFVFPEGDVPEPPTLFDGSPLPGGTVEISDADFEKFTKMPIQVIYGDFIPTAPSPIGGPDRWRARLILAQQFVDAVNSRGGDASLLHLPEVGVFGNTHFPFSDLNNREVADLLQQFLREKGLAKRASQSNTAVAGSAKVE